MSPGIPKHYITPPHATSRTINEAVEVVKDVETEIADVEGAGYCDMIFFYNYETVAQNHHSELWVECDDETAFASSFAHIFGMGFARGTPGVSLLKYDVGGICSMVVTKRFEFKSRFRVTVLNTVGNSSVSCFIFPTLME